MFHSIEDSRGSSKETGHQVIGRARISSNRAMRDSLGTVISNKAAESGGDPMQMQLAIEDGDPGTCRTSEPKPKKAKKELTEEQKAQKECDKNMSMNLAHLFIHVSFSTCALKSNRVNFEIKSSSSVFSSKNPH